MNEKSAEGLAEFYKCFSDPTRLRILSVLCRGELCVCDIAKTMDMNQSAISHQLNILKRNGLVAAERNGKCITYSVVDNRICHMLRYGLEFVEK